MKRIIFVFIIALLSSQAMAQILNNRINLKTGEIIKCSVITIDTLNQSLNYTVTKTGIHGVVLITDVGSYYINGRLNPYIPGKENNPNEEMEAMKQAIITNTTISDDQLNASGRQLVKFADNAQLGMAFILAGSIVTTLPWFIKQPDENASPDDIETFNNKQMVISAIGLGVSTLGMIVFITSFNNARNAGEIMTLSDKLSLNVNGNGIGMAFKIK